MESFQNMPIKWTYVTHMVERSLVAKVQPMEPAGEPDVGALVLSRVTLIGKHTHLEDTAGLRRTLFPGDVIAGVLGHRYATDQFEGMAVATGPIGHILGIGGVCGEVVGKNEKMPDPTCIEWIGRLADANGKPLYLSRFAQRRERNASVGRPRTLLSVGASMNSGKTTTAAHAVRAFSGEGHRVVAAKITGTACRKDLGIMEDAGALVALDFTHCGFPSTAYCAREELLQIASDVRSSLLGTDPEYVVVEIADGIFQRETRLLLEDPGFRSTIDAVLFAAGDSVSCDGAIRYLTSLGYHVAAVSGPVANSRLGRAEVEEMTGIPCLSREMILSGSLQEVLRVTWAA